MEKNNPQPELPIGIEADTGLKKETLVELKTDLQQAPIKVVAKEVAKTIVEAKANAKDNKV